MEDASIDLLFVLNAERALGRDRRRWPSTAHRFPSKPGSAGRPGKSEPKSALRGKPSPAQPSLLDEDS